MHMATNNTTNDNWGSRNASMSQATAISMFFFLILYIYSKCLNETGYEHGHEDDSQPA